MRTLIEDAPVSRWIGPALLVAAALPGGCAHRPPEITTGTPVPGAIGTVVSLDQGWTAEEQELFWFTSQGSRIVPYAWFLALEQARSEAPFASDQNIDRYRWLASRPTRHNPDGLPVGFVKDVDERSGESWVGVTCAACHTGQLRYRGVGIRIDGGPTLADAESFFFDLAAALTATQREDAKFQRFARAVQGGGGDPSGAAELRAKLEAVTGDIVARNRRNRPTPGAGMPGYARLDAFGNIFNEVAGHDLGVADNVKPPDAPVSYPSLWDTPQMDRVQWNGIAHNGGIGPLARNIGEALGAFARVNIQPERGLEGYESSVRVENMGLLEKWLDTLWSPQWPEKFLTAINASKAARGRGHYDRHCVSCHALLDRTNPSRRIQVVLVPISETKTDPGMATGALRQVATGRLKDRPSLVVLGTRFGDSALAADILGNAVAGTIIGQPVPAFEAALEEYMAIRTVSTVPTPVYRARPLNGVWATAPYLHNGSVPNLWSLLQRPEERPVEFHVGNREYDPVHVGYQTTPDADGVSSVFDTRRPGNANTGHAWGTTELSDEEKWELVEFLKSL
ncbi:MAG: hypothetical protein KF833_06670 [Verrucomicrobiae bacterium]|nr:hypothetical protein [Verrucomicrobiae bacterium]